MNLTRVLLVLATCLLAASVEASRSKRSLHNYQDMIGCILPGVSMHGLDYGCHCGSGNRGKPVDALDRCCMVHGQCYAKAIQQRHCDKRMSGQMTLDPSKVSYNFECNKRNPTCTNWCRSYGCGCKQFICECDRKSARCFAGAVRSYNPKYVKWPKDRCH